MFQLLMLRSCVFNDGLVLLFMPDGVEGKVVWETDLYGDFVGKGWNPFSILICG